MKPVFLIDYDYTLFDARKYKQGALFSTLNRILQLDIKTIENLWNEFIGKHGFINISEFAVVLSKKQKEVVGGESVSDLDIVEEVEKIDTSPYLNEGAQKMVQQLRELGPVIIYSQGDVVFQYPKMDKAELLEASKLTNKKPELHIIWRYADREKEKKPEFVRELDSRFNRIADSLPENELSIVIDPDKPVHTGRFASRLMEAGYSPWIIDDNASVLTNAYKEVSQTRPQDIGQLNLVFMDQGPHAKKERPTSLPDTAFLKANNLVEVQSLILKRVQEERGIPPVKLS